MIKGDARDVVVLRTLLMILLMLLFDRCLALAKK